MTPEVIGGDRQIVRGEPLHSFRGAAVTGTDPTTPRDTSKECRALFLVGSWHSQRAVEVDMGCGRSPKVRIHFWTPPKRIIWAARWLVPELKHMKQPALLQAALHPPLSLLLYVISSFFPPFLSMGL